MTSSRQLTAAALLLLVVVVVILVASSVSAFSTSCGGKLSSSARRQHVISGRPSRKAFDIVTIGRHQKPSSYYDIITSLKSSASSDTERDIITPPSTDAMKELGIKLILSAATYHGATSKMISINWKFDKIIVIVDTSADDDYIGDAGTNGGGVSCAVGDLIDDEFDDDELLEYELVDDYDDIDYDDNEEDFDDDDYDEEEEEDFETLQQQLGLQEQEHEEQEGNNQDDQKRTIDLTAIARTINEYLSQDGEDSLAFQIAKLYEIEVTTPEFDNVLRDYSSSSDSAEGGGGVNMFEVYKGFDVIVDYWEVPKKKKKKKSGKAGKDVVVDEESSATEEKDEEEDEEQKTKKVIEGKLVGRDNDKGVTMVNVKGRITKIKNDMIESVKLPKAKREKGVK